MKERPRDSVESSEEQNRDRSKRKRNGKAPPRQRRVRLVNNDERGQTAEGRG